ncbi:DUF6216 family protein [Pseudomonas viridiflava]|uniref:DUF6216 family protein n=1 Tax=Pseudomonas viridiflava TaxID=33069 RepID=UPI000F02B318|nr:DUF6216 family protein [Pseudomonas viridiflava]
MSDAATQTNAILHTVSVIKDISPAFMAFVTAALIIWAIFRARSAHFLLDKIWRVIGGGTTHDEDLKKAWLSVRDLEGFRFRTGIKFNTKSTLIRTLKWLEHNDKSLNDLSFAKAWIAGKPWEIKPPHMLSIRGFAFAVFLVTTPLTMGMFAAFTATSALLTIKDSGVTFWTDGVTARDFFLDRGTPEFTVDLATCNSGAFQALGEKDGKIVCSSLDPSKLPYVKSAITEQKTYSVFIAVFCLLGLTLTLRYSARAKMAHTLSKLPPPEVI